MTWPLYDAHNHLQDGWLTPHRSRIAADLQSIGVSAAVVNGTREADWEEVAGLCAAPPSPAIRLLPSFGLHPWEVGNRTPEWREKLAARFDATPEAFVGEIGLDRWILERARADDPRLTGLRRAPLDEQTEVFKRQLAIAAERNVPASIHCLDAFGPVHDVLRSTARPECGFLLHAYAGSIELAAAFAQLGGYFSFNGSFLDPRKHRLRELYARLPTDRLLVETDAPAMRVPAERERYTLPPTSDGQKPNHPANLAVAYAGLAEWRSVPVAVLAEQVEANFHRLFRHSTR